jgi:hypothetical protein
VLAHAKKNRKGVGLDNLKFELLTFGGGELKAHMLELFNNIVDKNLIPKEWQNGELIKKYRKGQNVNAKNTEELLFCLQPASYLQA